MNSFSPTSPLSPHNSPLYEEMYNPYNPSPFFHLFQYIYNFLDNYLYYIEGNSKINNSCPLYPYDRDNTYMLYFQNTYMNSPSLSPFQTYLHTKISLLGIIALRPFIINHRNTILPNSSNLC